MPIRIEIANESLRAGLPAFAAKVWSFLAVKPFWIGILDRPTPKSLSCTMTVNGSPALGCLSGFIASMDAVCPAMRPMLGHLC